MTDDERECAGLITGAADAWLPLALLAPRWVDASESLVADGLAVRWGTSPDGPAVTLTPLGAARLVVELREYAAKRAVTVPQPAAAWWSVVPPGPPKVCERVVAVPQWFDAAAPEPPRPRPRGGPVRSWFPDVPDHRPGPAEEAEANEEARFLMGVRVRPLKLRKVTSKKARVKVRARRKAG